MQSYTLLKWKMGMGWMAWMAAAVMSPASNKLPGCLAHAGLEKAIEYAHNFHYAQVEVRTHMKGARRSPPQSLQMMLARLTPRG